MDILLKLLPVFLAADLVIPFLLAPAYRGYSHRRQVMSALGNPEAPLHRVYNGWLLVYILIGNVPLFAGWGRSLAKAGAAVFLYPACHADFL